MTAAGAAGAQLAAREPPQKTSRFRGKSVSSRFNFFGDADAPEPPSLPRVRSKSVAGLRNPSRSISHSHPPLPHPPPPLPPLPPPPPPPVVLPLIPNFVLSAKPQSDASHSLDKIGLGLDGLGLEDLRRPPASPSVRSFISETASAHVNFDKELDDLAAQLDLEIEANQRDKEAELRRKEEDEAARYADEVARLEAETDRILAEQRKLDLARLQAQLCTPPPPPPTPTPTPKPKRVILDKLTLFGRSRKPNTITPSQPPGTPSTIAPTIFTPSLSRASSIDGSSPPPERMSFLDPGSRHDAPLSAINGGIRRVTVRCLSSTINLEVTADTSPVDILEATAAMTRHDIDVDTSIVIECYVVLGLERRLRRYERIRDAMNSWDRDQDNSLLVMTWDRIKNIKDLDIASVQRTVDPLSGFTVQLHHSSRPGKWTKRFVTLINTGQMFASKKGDAQYSDKDSISLCHLSDFDIYKPKESELRRHLKPPKKICFAIKSQQRTVVFPNGENYVHFFSTDDNELADRFYEMVHSWRSWYLVNKQLNVRVKTKPPQLNFELAVAPNSSIEAPLTTGSFIEESDFAKAIEESAKKLAEEAKRNKAMAKRKPSVVSVAPTVKSEREFAPDGLLGDAYDKRKVEAAEAATEAAAANAEKAEGPFTEGPSLLNSIVIPPPPPEPEPEARSWFPSATEHTARARSESVHHVKRPVTAESGAQPPREKGPQKPAQKGPPKGPPPPLLNFAGNFPEPPRSPMSPRHGPKPRGPEPLRSPLSPRFGPGFGPDPLRSPMSPRFAPGAGLEPPRSPRTPRPGPGPGSAPRPGSRQGQSQGQGQGLRPPPGSPLINYATGGPPGGRLGPPPANGPPPPPPGTRSRSRSNASIHPSNRHLPPSEDLPPLPPMSPRGPGPRSNKMPPLQPPPRGRDQRHERPQSPLVNRAR